ncbi:hypothetical protein [Spirosoma pollinicola]|uniref:Uncharacterized protein n=1 Tax=Spirosoma pollinicola TaxID=2057025 RepID=A0A2K8Z6R6_9BACT|nr:hypothetical protein [Spirosoma pollinicola]AUD05563.1 hypothetical protein CWM47_29195 [Spirosoma pollinicola]
MKNLKFSQKIFFLPLLYFYSNNVFSQMQLIPEGTIGLGNKTNNIIQLNLSENRKDWTRIYINPKDVKIYTAPFLFVIVDDSDKPKKFMLKQLKDSAYVFYYDQKKNLQMGKIKK